MIKELAYEHKAIFVLITLLLVNALGFAGWRAFADRAMKCVQYQGPRPGKAMNYLIAGNVAQPAQAFAFLLGDLEGEVVFCNYRQGGWNARLSAEEICRDMNMRISGLGGDTLVRIYAISCGDIVARYLESMSALVPYAQIEIVAINPAPEAKVLKPYARWGLRIVAPLIEVACHAAGFLSCIPLIPSKGSWHSPILLADQWMEIAYAKPPHKTALTTGVILSSHDAFLVNEEVSEYFSEVRKIEIAAEHATTLIYPEVFAKACQLATEARNPQQIVR